MTGRPTVVFVHGLMGQPNGTRARTIRDAGVHLVAPAGRNRPLAERIPDVIEAVRANPGCRLVGSSYGGLAALYVAQAHHHLLSALVLSSPALNWSEPPVGDPSRLLVPPTLPAAIIHGVLDTVVPIAVSRALARRSPHVQLVEVWDDHLLAKSLDRLAALARGPVP